MFFNALVLLVALFTDPTDVYHLLLEVRKTCKSKLKEMKNRDSIEEDD